MAQTVKTLPAKQETWIQSPGQEDPVKNGMATLSSILTWRIPWTEEPDRLQSMGLKRVRYDWATNTHTHTHTHTHAHQYSFHCSIPRGLAFKTSHEDHDLFLLLENYFLSTRGPYKKLGCQVSFDTLVTTKLQHSVIRYFQQRAKYFIFQQTDKFPPLMELPF